MEHSTHDPSPISQDAELRELCDRYSPFSVREWANDEQWLATQLRNGNLGKADGLAPGKIVAVYDAQIVAIGDDETTMRLELSKQYNAHPGRFVLQRLNRRSFRKKFGLGYAVILGLGFVILCCVYITLGSLNSTKTTFQRIGSGVK